MRVALGVEYDGSAYHGWQVQKGLLTLQATLELALSKVAGHEVVVTCAGRTDAGVHAYEQVVHFDSDAVRNERGWSLGVNAMLPKDIRVLWAAPVSRHFHARFSAVGRTYRYVIYNSVTHPALFRRYVAWYRYPLAESPMKEAATYLLGEHDFSSFRGSDCQAKSPIRTVYASSVERQGDLWIFTIKANGFLHHMVRNMVAVLLEIGRGRQHPKWMEQVLRERKKTFHYTCAPPHGLYLQEVSYPSAFNLPSVAKVTDEALDVDVGWAKRSVPTILF